ncbi:MAG: hypothetical protein K2X27_04425 [Candidatus Obscuribacterales bacterium]|nr:hypothetical protein [Candidatus Obscuribacterales bacterium]
MKKYLLLAVGLSLLLPYAAMDLQSAGAAVPTTTEELKAEKIKGLAKRDPRAEDLLNKAQAKVDKMKQSGANPAQLARLQSTIDHIAFASGGMGETRLKADMELLEAIVKEHKEPSAEELAPLQERYKKLCAQFDDIAFSKDLDRAFHIHDKFVRYTSLGLWDKDKISAELQRMEGLVERAPDIAFGVSQMVDSCKNKRLVSVPKLVYMGSASHEECYLSSDRRSVGVIDESFGKPLNMELAEHVIQGPDGKLSNLFESNAPALLMPFSPPLSLWAKSRIQEGRVPAIMLKLVDGQVKSSNPAYSSASAEFLSVADLLAGKLDDYMKENLKHLGPDKTPLLLGIISDFDRDAAATAFGADGRTPYYMILDPKLKNMPEDKRADEVRKRLEKGSFSTAKANSAELSNQYGDPAVPDGPERVKDAFKHISKLVNQNSGGSIVLFSSAGAFHGNKNAGKFAGEQSAGNQPWNKLEHYFPGEGVLEWIGINAVGSDPVSDPKGANLMESLDPFMAEVRSSAWQSTPVMLLEPAPARVKSPMAETAWLTTMFARLIPATFPNVLAIFVGVPEGVTLWSPDGKSAFRTYVSSNKFFNYKMRFKSLAPAAGSNPPAASSSQ